MKINHRSFTGKTFRPSPCIHESESEIAIVTPWNTTVDKAQEAIEFFKETYSYLASDQDSTRPFATMHSFSEEENNLHQTCLQLNQKIYNQYNQEELSMGFEAFFMVREESKMIFAQIGCPHIYLAKKDLPLQLIGPALSLSLAHSTNRQSRDPLPHALLGLFNDISIGVYSITAQPMDQMVLVSRSMIPSSFLESTSYSLESLSKTLAKDNANEPFWLALVTL